MSSLFIDTSGWANIFIPTETYHTQATFHIREAQVNRQTLVTTNYVVSELVALLGSRYRSPRLVLFRYINHIKTNPIVRIVHIDIALDKESWELCQSRQDKAWSLVDASSFVIMDKLGIKNALTTDRHFEQAGFVRLLKAKGE